MGIQQLPGQTLSMAANPFDENIFPKNQFKPPPTHLEAISYPPITYYLEEKNLTLTLLQHPFK